MGHGNVVPTNIYPAPRETTLMEWNAGQGKLHYAATYAQRLLIFIV